MTSIVADIVSEAADAALRQLPLTGDDLEQAKALVMRAALSSTAIKRKFSYATSEKGFVASGKGKVHVAPGFGAERDLDLPSLKLPNVVRQRQRKLRFTINHLLPARTVEFFNSHYSRDIDFDFAHVFYHDHPEAAASKKIETEVVMSMLRSRHADLLRVPTNGYDFSVIDSGGDWRYHHVRKHHGVHIDAPFLDDRDRSRDTRKRMQLTADAINDAYVCRELSQHCMRSAPYMMAVHSVLYTTRLVQICETMAARGVLYFVGTMQLPEELRQFNGKYVDPHYGFTVDYQHKDSQYTAQYVPPKLRHGFGKYLFTDAHKRVVYRYPNGESREYIHDLDVLTEKLDPKTFIIPTAHGAEYVYSYRIAKRVGSLIYAEIQFVDNTRPAHSRLMVGVPQRPFDGYRISFDENLLHDFSITTMRTSYINAPRHMFTPVAAYCLTKVKDPSFQIEHAISYVQSAASKLEANGTPVHVGMDGDLHSNMVITGAAAFFWAFDRYRLLDARLSSLRVAEAQTEVQSSLGATVDSLVDFRSTFQALKSSLSDTLFKSATDYVVGRTTSYNDVRKLYESLSTITSPGLHYIRDLHVCYYHLQELRVDGVHVAHQVGQSFVEAMVPTYPTYELEQPTRLLRTAIDVPSTVGSDSGIDVSSGISSRGDVNVAPVLHDMVTLAEAAEAERSQTAAEVYKRVFSPDTRSIRSMEDLKGTIKGQPTILHYTEGNLLQVQTLTAMYQKGEESFSKFVDNLVGQRFIYPEKDADAVFFGTGVLRPDYAFQSDRKFRTTGQTFSALLDPTINVLNASRLRDLRASIPDVLTIDATTTQLSDEVAGSGKTHAQCVAYRDAVSSGKTCAIFASTKAAANQARMRLLSWEVEIAEGSISSVDAFLMNARYWRRYDYVMIDEALQLHAGKIYAVMHICKPSLLRGFGDTKQIGFIPFTRFHKPSVVTDFPWGVVKRNLITRRYPAGRIVEWLQSDMFYGPEHNTLSPVPEGLQLYIQVSSYEQQMTLPLLYQLMGLRPEHELLIMCYLQDEILRVRSKLFLTPEFPTEDQLSSGERIYNAAAKTVGEAQGDDVDNALILRLTTRDEPLYGKTAQTTVALTRHKRKIGIIMQISKFPMLIEKVGGVPTTVPDLRSGISQRLLNETF